jgi:ribosomal protein S11
MDSKENPEEFAQMQAEFQAESQMFKMFQEAISTMIKSIGEGLSSVARKQ